MNSRGCIALVTVMFTAVALCGCRTNGGAPEFPPHAMVLRLADADDIPTLDPAAGYDTLSWTFEQAIFDTLVRYGEDNVELEPDLATRWESAPDAMSFTFHLRRDARFSTGRAVTSGDVRYGIERVIDPATRSKGMEYYRGIAGADDFAAHRAVHVSGIETPDAWTISFHLSAPDPIFPHKLAMPFAAAVAREAVARWGEDFSHHPVGSGAFMLREWRGGQRIVIVRNPFYFDQGLPRLDAVVDSLGVDSELQWLRFEAGDLDLVAQIPPAEFPYVMKTSALAKLVLRKTTVTTEYLGMNCRMPPFDDVRVRRAMSYAIDRHKLVAILNGRGVVAHEPLPPNMPGFVANLESYSHDPARARALLDAAHMKGGFSFDIWMRADATVLMLGQSIQQDLADVGVSAILKPVAWGPFLEAIRQPHTAPAFLYGWEADFPDPANVLGTLLSRTQWGSNNDSFYYNPQFEALLDRAARETDFTRRYALYDRAQQIAIADAPWVFLYYPVIDVIHQPWVHNYVLNPMRPTRFEHVWLSARGK